VPLVGAVLLIGIYVYYGIVIYRDYLPFGDDPAFVSATFESPASWFTRGYFNYFRIYPEWDAHSTTLLLKPITNVVGYVNQALFGSNYALHFAAFFAFQFIGLVIFVRILRELEIAPVPTAVMSLLFLFNPAFMSDGLVSLPSHFDVLAGVFALAAFFTVWRQRYGATLVLLTLAVFTKEPALYAPLAAALCVLIWRGRPIVASLLLLPLPLWASARFLAFGDILGTGDTGRPGQIVTGLSVWPTGLGSSQLVYEWALPSGRPAIVAALFFLANIGMWVFLCYASFAAVRAQIDAPDRAALATGLLIWTLGALSFGVVAGYHYRYGGSIYPFLYLFLSALFFSPAYRVPRWAMATVLLVFAVATAVQSLRNARLALAWEAIRAPERALHDALQSLPQDGRTVYVVNAPGSLASAPHRVARAWSLNLKMVIVIQFRGCPISDAGSTQRDASRPDLFSVHIPDCAEFEFRTGNPDVLDGPRGVVLERAGIGTYAFPEGVAPSPGAFLEPGLGRTLLFEIDPMQIEPTLVAYNWKTGAYEPIPRGSS
jgi:hypothetical protein